jgi:argininosuccinate lyase
VRERLRSEPSEILAKYINIPRLAADNERSFENMARVNEAHVLMLKKQKIISLKDAKILLSAISELKKKGSDVIELNPNFEDYYFNTEQYLISQIGIDAGGRLHTARSRNDLHSTILRMNIRDAFLSMLPRILELRKILLNLALRYKDTVVTGYTHMQPAQPMTMGFYFAGLAESLERDFERLEGSYRHLNYSTLGACAFAGTSFPIDRHYTAELLGFYGPIINTIDAIATRDYVLEIMASFSIIASTLNRFAHDLYYWATDEFGYIELDDSVCNTSSIMPQKKNPAVLEYLKAKCSHQLSAFVDCFCCLRGIPFCHNRDLGGESIHLLWDSFNEMEAMVELLKEVLRKIKVKEENMKDRANNNFCTVTELADELVKSEGFSFRLAHQIVGHVVLQCVEKGMKASEISLGQLNEATKLFAEKTLDWDDLRLRKALDSLSSVENKISLGSPSPSECESMTKTMTERLEVDENQYKKYLSDITAAYNKLDNEVGRLLNEQ